MAPVPLPLSALQLEAVIAQYPTPFHLYDEAAIRANAARLQAAFAWAPGFREYFAVKATPNPYILAILGAAGCGVDCSSAAELELAARTGFAGDAILFTSNDTPAAEFQQARALGALINLDDLTHLPYLATHAGLPDRLCFRYNPGAARTGTAIIGQPGEAKFGLPRDQLVAAYRQARDQGVTRFGLHAMVASNERNAAYLVETARMLFTLVRDLRAELGIAFDFVNLGGGIGIPYRPDEAPVDLAELGAAIRAVYAALIPAAGVPPVQIFMECGRLITGPAGWLVTTVRHLKQTYKQFIGLDASMADLMRPGLYGAYHHITVVGQEHSVATGVYDVTGSLCENNDKFAVDRPLPPVAPGARLVIHDTGAHGHAMGFNYNGKLRAAELLLRPDGTILRIRRAETLADYFATLDFAGLAGFPG